MIASHSRPKEFYKNLPKVELHRHLEGSLRLATMLELAHLCNLDLPASDPPRLRAMVQVQPTDPPTATNFLSKFETLRLFFRSQQIIERITREAIADAAADNVRYMELRFTPVALGNAKNYPLSEVMDWVIASARQAEKDFGVTTRLIASFNRHESVALAEKVVELAAGRMADGIVGIDLAGAEGKYPGRPFEGVFRAARAAGLHVTIHAGEWGGPENVVEAIETLHAERVGHGVRVMEDPKAVALARERGIVFEVCPTSNFHSGVFPSLEQHPLPRMLEAGLAVTLNTDDPGISAISLSDECQLACEALSLSGEQLKAMLLKAATAAFLPQPARERLTAQMSAELFQPDR